MKKVLTIAGSDPSGGAGIQADLKTMTVHGVYGMSAITALTAQNTMGVFGVQEATPDFVALQLDLIFEDILPDAVKIGMVSNEAIIHAIADRLTRHGAKQVVIDPVMFATSGHSLMSSSAMSSLQTKLLPLATIITPNLSEASALYGKNVDSKNLMVEAGKAIASKMQTAVLIKGGHLDEQASDLLVTANGHLEWYESERIENSNTHGTGCTLSAAIASNLALGHSLSESVHRSKQYITACLRAQLNLGQGRGPLHHMVQIPE